MKRDDIYTEAEVRALYPRLNDEDIDKLAKAAERGEFRKVLIKILGGFE